jgi:hypothetical protein
MDVNTIYVTQSTPANCRDGPRFERGITDCYCCILYILFCLAMVTVVVVYRNTSVTGYEKPFDYDHQPCIGAKSLLYIPTNDLTKTVCVERCPNRPRQPMPCRVNTRFPVCPMSAAGLIIDKGHHICYHYTINVGQLTGRINMKSATDAIIVGHREILVTAGGTAALAIILLITTFIFPELMTCLYLILFELLLAVISAGFFYRYFRGKLPFVDIMAVSSYQSNVVTLIIAIVFAVAFVLSLIILLSKISRIQFVVTVLKFARRCLWDNLYMLLVSFILSAISVTVLAVNLLMFYNASSNGQINALKHGPYDQFEYDSSKWWWAVCLLILYLWSHGLMIAISDFLYEGFATYWYFN